MLEDPSGSLDDSGLPGRERTDKLMGNIRFLKECHVFRSKTEVQGINSTTQMLALVGTDDRRHNLRLGQKSGQSHLHHRYLIAL